MPFPKDKRYTTEEFLNLLPKAILSDMSLLTAK